MTAGKWAEHLSNVIVGLSPHTGSCGRIDQNKSNISRETLPRQNIMLPPMLNGDRTHLAPQQVRQQFAIRQWRANGLSTRICMG